MTDFDWSAVTGRAVERLRKQIVDAPLRAKVRKVLVEQRSKRRFVQECAAPTRLASAAKPHKVAQVRQSSVCRADS